MKRHDICLKLEKNRMGSNALIIVLKTKQLHYRYFKDKENLTELDYAIFRR